MAVRREKVRVGYVRQSIPRVSWAFRQRVHGLWTVGVTEEIVARVPEGSVLLHVVRPIGHADGCRRSLRMRVAFERLRARRNPGTAMAASNAMLGTITRAHRPLPTARRPASLVSGQLVHAIKQ